MDHHLKTIGREDSAWRIVGLYAAFAFLWILVSDTAVATFFSEGTKIALASTIKGWLFVAVTSVLLFVLIDRLIYNFKQALFVVRQREGELIESRRLLLEAQQIAGLGQYELDISSRLWNTSEICDQILGINNGFDRVEDGWKELIHPQDLGGILECLNGVVLSEVKSYAREMRVVRPSDNAVRWIRVLGEFDADASGHLHRLYGTVQDITEQKLVEAQIQDTNNKLKATLAAMPDLLFEVNHDGYIYQYHSHRDDLLAAPPEVFLGKRFDEILPAAASLVCREAIDEADAHGFSTGKRYSLDLPQGARWFELSVAPMFANQESVRRFILIARDVTERYNAEKQLELAGLVFNHSREGIMVTDANGLLVDVNEAFTRITGYSRQEALGKNPKFLSSGRQTKEFYSALWTNLREAGFWTGEIWNRRKDGAEFAELLTISSVRNAGGETVQYVALFSDITPLKTYQSELEHIAHFDSLTGLPNRLLLSDRLKQAMAQADRSGQSVVIAYLDMDDFKLVNDQHGHAVGDKLLTAMAQRVGTHLRDTDTLARIGGDEFVAVLTGFNDTEVEVLLVERMIAEVSEPFYMDGLTLTVSTSVGITSYPQGATLDAEQLLRQADQAMYQAKVAGKNRYHVFDTKRDSEVRGHFDVVERIRVALKRSEFTLFYQPKVNMRTGQIIGAEALLRWLHPDNAMMLPGTFLPAIEDHLLSIDIGEWVIETAIRQHEAWGAMGLQIPVSVNVGALQLQQADFVPRLQAVLSRHPAVNPANVQMEILETSALQDMHKATATINACKDIGVDFALDDFGTGYSSLTYLRQLPVSVLKIDQSFVRNMLENSEDQKILKGVIGLAEAFGRRVIAEGVETEDHGTLLLQLGCEAAQGYGIAKPMPADAFPAWVQNWRPNPDWAHP